MPQFLYRNYSFLSTLSLVWWEYLSTFDDEYELVWRRPINTIKCIFIFSRYTPLIVLTINIVLVFGPLSHPYVDTSICRAWFTCLYSSTFALYIAMEIFLIARVYALYRRDKSVAFYLCTLTTVEIVLGVRCIIIVFKDAVFRSHGCDGKGVPQEVFYCGCALLSQFSLWYMTYARRNIIPGTVPVLRVVARDGFSAFVVLCALFGMTIPYSTVSEYSSAHIVFNWPLTLISIVTCRMIVNLQRINVTTANSADQNQTLTIILESLQSSSTA